MKRSQRKLYGQLKGKIHENQRNNKNQIVWKQIAYMHFAFHKNL